jgi:hypothetical protein
MEIRSDNRAGIPLGGTNTMVSKASPKEATAAVETPTIEWGKIDNLNDARAALGVVVNISELLGDGSEFIKNKDTLVTVPFLILDWNFIVDEDSKREYVNVLIMGADGRKGRFNDGGTGVYAQLKQIQEECGKVGVEVKGGLRKSTYNNEHGAGTTFYLSV